MTIGSLSKLAYSKNSSSEANDNGGTSGSEPNMCRKPKMDNTPCSCEDCWECIFNGVARATPKGTKQKSIKR